MTPSAGNARRVTLVNPPYHKRVMRRFTASYFAPNFLMPPTDLLYVASAARQFAGAETRVLDAVAKSWTVDQSLDAIRATNPAIVFLQIGYATVVEDIAFARRVRAELGVPVVAMGYLPTVMGPEIMAASDLDAVVQGEPEYAFAELLKAWREGREPAGVPGVLYRKDGAVAAGPPPRPVERFDDLPFPDHGAVDAIDYNEVMVGRRIASIFTARGCPYPCTFCVRSFGRRLSKRSPESVLAEVRHIVNDLGIRNLRIMDDTFTLDEDRAAEICEGFIKLGPVRWTALTRLDHLTEPLAGVMARSDASACIAASNPAPSDCSIFYKKGVTLDAIRKGVRIARGAGIELSAFFIVGAPGETREEFEASVRFAQELDINYVIVTRLQYWPGTTLFETFREKLLAGENPFHFSDGAIAGRDLFMEREREFYRRFYVRPRYIARNLRRLLPRPGEIATNAATLARYLVSRRQEDFI